MASNSVISTGPGKWSGSLLWFVLAIILFLFSIDMVAGSLTMLGGDTAQSILLATSNPFIGLFIGLLTTALIQSSSTVTTMIVAVVASGYISLPNAIPVVMGANIGTTLTSTLVSLGFVTKRNEFRKALSAGSMHDFFNIIVVLLLFPLEYYYGTLSYLAVSMTDFLGGMGLSGGTPLSIGDYSFSNISQWVIEVLPESFITILLSLVLLFASIKLLSKVIYARLIGESKDKLRRYVFRNPYKSFGWGTLLTSGVQSSSITTSLMVPLVASGRVSLKNAFPFIMGANLGTTITALLAAFNRTEAALSIALVHVLINLIGVLIFLPFPVIRRIPVQIAYRFGAMTLESRVIGFSYMIFTFFLLPFTLIYLNRDSVETAQYEFSVMNREEVEARQMIIVNKDNVKSFAQFLIYNGVSSGSEEQELALPDTSFVVADADQLFVDIEGRTNYNSDLEGVDSYGAYKLRMLSHSETYDHDAVKLSELISLEKTYSSSSGECHKAYLLIDSEKKLLISAEYYDHDEHLLKSVKLESIR
ncbi:MAG: Na/Pi cotransporter family protein [Roseivirga sp.]|nr:Na/Pi cotransporter family protein [Roseivirga sp.]